MKACTSQRPSQHPDMSCVSHISTWPSGITPFGSQSRTTNERLLMRCRAWKSQEHLESEVMGVYQLTPRLLHFLVCRRNLRLPSACLHIHGMVIGVLVNFVAAGATCRAHHSTARPISILGLQDHAQVRSTLFLTLENSMCYTAVRPSC